MINIKNIQHFSYDGFISLFKNLKKENLSPLLQEKIDSTLKDYEISDRGSLNIPQQAISLHYFNMKNNNDEKKHHTVAFGRCYEGFFIHCGNIDETQPKNAPCNFFTNPITVNLLGNGKLLNVCKHTLAVIDLVHDDMVAIHIPELESDWQQEFGAKQNISIEVDELSYLRKFAFRANVIIEGDRGVGKTYDVTQFALQNNLETVFMGGHNGVESIDLLGCLVPYSNSSAAFADRCPISANDLLSDAEPIVQTGSSQTLLWKDGPITEAFRKAATGKKTLLILDELLRIPQRELNILLTALSPINNYYHLRTGRIISADNGIGKEETIKAPIEKLFVVGTTNVGSQYAIDDIDPALAERFIVIRKDTTERQLKTVLSKLIKAKAFDEKLIFGLIDFYLVMKEAKKQGFVENIPTIRTFSRSIELAEKSEEVWEYIKSHILLWIGRDMDGYPMKEQEEAVLKLISKSQSITH